MARLAGHYDRRGFVRWQLREVSGQVIDREEDGAFDITIGGFLSFRAYIQNERRSAAGDLSIQVRSLDGAEAFRQNAEIRVQCSEAGCIYFRSAEDCGFLRQSRFEREAGF